MDDKRSGWWQWYVVCSTSAGFLVLGYFVSLYKWMWGAGKEGAIILMPFLLAVPLLVTMSQKSGRMVVAKRLSLLLVVACLGALWWHVTIFRRFVDTPQVNDIAGRALQGIAVLAEGNNPYSIPIDPKPELAGRWFDYQSLVYLPMTVLAYFPLGALYEARGLLATNFILDLTTAGLLFWLGHRLVSPAAGAGAAFLYLAVLNVPYELFRTGATDIAAVMPLLVALLLLERRPAWAGFFVGLSIAAKLLPGLFFALCFFPRSAWRRYGSGVLAGLAPLFIFLFLSPKALLGSAVLFSFIRSVDPTSWLYGFSPLVSIGVR